MTIQKKGEGRRKYRYSLRFSEHKYKELQRLLASSDYRNMAQMLRDILDNRKLKMVYRDASVDSAMLIFGEYLKSLQQLVIIMEQITRKVTELCDLEGLDPYEQRMTDLLQEYSPVIDKASSFINEIGIKWLQK